MAAGAKSKEAEAADEALPAYKATAGPLLVGGQAGVTSSAQTISGIAELPGTPVSDNGGDQAGATSSAQTSSSISELPGTTVAENGGDQAGATSSAQTISGTAELPGTMVPDNRRQGPTIAAPFNFPTTYELPPSYSLLTPSGQRPIAIPQISPDVAAPFLQAYPPSLLSYGISKDTWTSFVKTTNAFLTANVGDQAVHHAADVARKMSDLPKRYSRDTVAQAQQIRRDVRENAKKGNYIAAGVSAISGSVALPMGAAFRLAGASMALPFAMADGLTAKPKTPRQRAAAYVAAANGRWFHGCGLDARLLDSEELAAAVATTPGRMADLARAYRKGGALGQMAGLGEWIADVEVGAAESDIKLDWGARSLWLVVLDRVPAAAAETNKGKEKDDDYSST